jgi:signal transduction histidine kinase
VRVSRSAETLRIDVADDGPGAPTGVDVFATGIGLSATRDRLRLLYGDAHRFDAGNRGGGFVVSITIPYRRAVSPATDVDGEAVLEDAASEAAVVTR